MRRPTSLLVLCVLMVCSSFPSAAEDKGLTLPAEAKGEVGRLVKLVANGTAEIHWDVDDSLAKEGEYYIDSQGKTIVLPCPKEGSYKVRALSVVAGKLQVRTCVVTIGGQGRIVKENPSPTKETTPPSALASKLVNAYKQDLSSREGTEADLRKMVQVYKQGKFIARNVRNKTGEEVFSGLRQVAVSVALDDRVLGKLRQSIAEYLGTKIIWELEKELTAEQRDIIATAFADVHKALEGI